VYTVMMLLVSCNVGKFLRSSATGGLYVRTRLHGVSCQSRSHMYPSSTGLISMKVGKGRGETSLYAEHLMGIYCYVYVMYYR
jgi:hypothetical protein